MDKSWGEHIDRPLYFDLTRTEYGLKKKTITFVIKNIITDPYYNNKLL